MESGFTRITRQREFDRSKARFRHILPLAGVLLTGPLTGCISKSAAEKIVAKHFKKSMKAAKECLFFTTKQFAMPLFAAIRKEDIKAADSELKELFDVKEINQIPKTMETVLKIFDRVVSIKYRDHRIEKESDDVQFPSQTLKNRSGDCDDQAPLLALMLNIILPNSTRAMRVEIMKETWEGHQYVQIDLRHIPEIKKIMEAKDSNGKDVIEFLTDKIAQHYKLERKVAWVLVNWGLETSSRGLVGELDAPQFASGRTWFTMDTTEKVPGGGSYKNSNTRLKAIFYPLVERMGEMEKYFKALEKGEAKLSK
jgi:hypothetical protein